MSKRSKGFDLNDRSSGIFHKCEVVGPQLSNLGVDLCKAAKGKYRALYGNNGYSEFKCNDTLLYRDTCVQWNNAVHWAMYFSVYIHDIRDKRNVVIVDMNNVIHAIMATIYPNTNGRAPAVEFAQAKSLVISTFMSLGNSYPGINFVLVGTNGHTGELGHKLIMPNIVELNIPCVDTAYEGLCTTIHGYTETDDFFIVIVAGWLLSINVNVGILSHDKYSWWDNHLDVPRAYINANGMISAGPYDPNIYYGLKIFMGLPG